MLAAARELFAEEGVSASLNDLVRRAGVGPATLYRHFPTREALVEALLRDRQDGLTARVRELRDTRPPLDAVIAWLTDFMAQLASYRGLADPVKDALTDETSAPYASCHAMRDAWADLLVQARRSGAVREDADPTDLLRLAAAIAWSAEGLPDRAAQTDRLLRLTLEGFTRR